MEDTLTISEQQIPQQEDPPRKKLYKGLVKKQLYTKSYEDFEKQFSTPDTIDKLYAGLTEKQLYTKDRSEFQKQFFSDLTPEKKKSLVGSVDLENSSLNSKAPSQLNGEDGSEIPTVDIYTTDNGEMVEANPIALSKKYKELQDKTTLVSDIEGGTYLPDEAAQKAAKKLKEDFKDVDLGGIYEETKDLSDELLAKHGNRLMKEREDNPQLYQRDKANLQWRSGFEKQILDDVDKGNITPDEYNQIKHGIETLPIVTAQGDYSNQRSAVQSLAKSIQIYGGENKDKLLKDFAVEVSKVYGNPDNKTENTFKDTLESEYFTPEAQLGYQYIQDVSPEKAEQYKRLLIDPKTLKDKPDELRGYNHLMQTLEETGIGLQQNAIKEELNNLNKIADQNNGLTDEQLTKAVKLEDKQAELEQKKAELDKKYPDRIIDKVSYAVNEIMGHELNWGEYAMVKTGQALKNTGQGIWEAVSSPFMSDASNSLRELAIMGENISTEQALRQPDKNKNLLYDHLIIQPELQSQVDVIKNDKNLSEEQKRSKLFSLFYTNTDKFGRVPIQDGKFNVSPSSILYGLTDLGAGLIPFVGLEAITGGVGGTGAAAKFIRTFTAAAATTFHDEYAAALMEGKGQSEAYKIAMGTTAINSLAMAGAGTPTEIRAMASGMKTSASKIIAQMSDDAIQKVLSKGTPKGLKALGQSLKERVKATPALLGQGLKTGAKFEGYMAGANVLNDREVDFKHAILNIANFGILGAGLGHIGYKSPTQLQKSGLVKMGENPKEFHLVAEEMKKDGILSQSEFDHRKDLIDKSEAAYKVLPKANAKGKPLTENEKAEYLYNSVIKNEGNSAKSNLPPKQAEKAQMTALVADHKNDLILEPKTDKQLEDRKGLLERKLELNNLDNESTIKLSDTEKLNVEAELQAVKDTIEENAVKVADENAKLLLEKNKSNGEIKTDEIPVTETGSSDTAPKVGEAAPATETGEEKVTGVKREITDETRAENNMPKVDFPKMNSDFDALNEAKERVDRGKVNPQQMVDRILAEKGNYKNEGEVMDMQYYAHQLEKKNQELNTKLSEAKTPEEQAGIRGQKMQLSDLMDAQTEAAQTAGNQWGKTGNRMQSVINDAGVIFRENKAVIKDAYGGEVPKDVQAKIDAITKERDDAIAAKTKLEEELKQKMAAKGFEEIKKRAAKASKTKETAEALKKEEQDLLQQLKDAGKADPNAPKRSGVGLTDKHIVIIGKLALNYFKQGVNGLDAMIDKIHDAVRNDISGITRKDIRDLLANYDPLTMEREIERLNKKADILDNKLTPPSVDSKGKPTEKTDFAKPSKVERTFRNNTEWVKANQRVSNAEFKMKIEKRKAFESKKNYLQRGLMWLGRLTRLSVLSGTTVLQKLAAAATIGSAIKRIPEQVIGGVYSQAFKGIAKKAPIEGFLNAKSEAKFYKEFLNPIKFGKNAWEILKTGSSPLSRRLGSAEYEHVPILYLPTDTHQIIKDPPKRATFEASFRNSLIWAEKNGLDINDPLVINSLENAAYKRAQYEIFQEQNWLSKKFTSYKSSLEKKGNIGAAGKFLVDFMIPVSTVPTNIVRRIATTSPIGLIRGSKEVVDAYRKGIEKLTPEQADHVMQQLKQGTLGTALWLIGWYGVGSFGGLYSHFNPNSKRDEEDKVSDVMEVNGVKINKPTQHALPLEIIQMAATARRIYDNYRENKNASTPEALYKAGLGSIGAALEQIPVIETPVHMVMATQDPTEANKLKEDIDRRLVPQIVREQMDKTKGSEDLKYLQDKGLKIVDLHKEALEPLDKEGKRVFVTDKKFKEVVEEREKLIKEQIAEARKKGFIIWETGETIKPEDITPKQLKSWLMGTSTKAKNEAIEKVFGEQPEKEPTLKVEVNQ